MSEESEHDDDLLLEELRSALGVVDPVPDSAQDAAKAAFLTLDLDRELAELIHDSSHDREPVLTRGDTVRTLSFRAGQLLIELEVHQSEGLIVGMLVPSRSATVELEVEGLVAASVVADSFGRFRFDNVSAGPMAIVCRTSHQVPRPVCTIRFEF